MEVLFAVTDEVSDKAFDSVPDDQKLEQLDFYLDDGDVKIETIFRKRSNESFERYLDGCSDRDLKNPGKIASLQFIKDNLVAPNYEEFYPTLEEYPALAVQIGNELAKNMGFTRKVEKKTLTRKPKSGSES